MRPAAILASTGAWFALGLGLAYENSVLGAKLWILLAVVHMLYAMVGLALMSMLLKTARTQKGLLRFVPLLFVACAAALWFLFPHVSDFGDDRRFLAAKPQYDAIVADVRRRGFPPVSRRGGTRFNVDSRLRMVAFPQPGRIIDNWVGIVWDPSHRVATARSFTRENGFTADPTLKRAFGGDLVGCRPIVGDYFRCGFT